LSLSYFFFLTHTPLDQGEKDLKVTRYYASRENALNAKIIIQDLLVSELERMIDRPANERNQTERSDRK
jgi:hypothetical protein